MNPKNQESRIKKTPSKGKMHRNADGLTGRLCLQNDNKFCGRQETRNELIGPSMKVLYLFFNYVPLPYFFVIVNTVIIYIFLLLINFLSDLHNILNCEAMM